ncbi:hypothetical protein NLJ89_g6102 [Agrocybe chaxingu]|uniref:Uncharacterized protein n=1 Tax=Agrocybe chaxingu TaxID=84603 RepID=A0A9W8JZZ0_9AGAR|nr:hypothetical protein NLJ89_g6102 [Agrocybe chaxingu]
MPHPNQSPSHRSESAIADERSLYDPRLNASSPAEFPCHESDPSETLDEGVSDGVFSRPSMRPRTPEEEDFYVDASSPMQEDAGPEPPTAVVEQEWDTFSSPIRTNQESQSPTAIYREFQEPSGSSTPHIYQETRREEPSSPLDTRFLPQDEWGRPLTPASPTPAHAPPTEREGEHTPREHSMDVQYDAAVVVADASVVRRVAEHFPAVPLGIVFQIAEHTFCPSYLYLLDVTHPERYEELKLDDDESLLRVYPDYPTLMKSLTVYFNVLHHCIELDSSYDLQDLRLVGDAAFTYIAHLAHLQSEYTWSGVLTFHKRFFRLRLEEMKMGNFHGWKSTEKFFVDRLSLLGREKHHRGNRRW